MAKPANLLISETIGVRRGNQVRVTGQDMGRGVVTNIREWYEKGGEWHPGVPGIAIKQEEIDALIQALQSIRDEVHDRGGYTFPIPEEHQR